ncbi:hypothetical protein OIU76_007409 [Salix suchowensis]|nr:hypothetical protein OIU76_007409 [Salix suchowensis]
MAPSFDWWAKDSHKGTPVVVKMENPNWSMVELEGPSEEDFLITDSPSRLGRDKSRNKNAKQLTWVLLLKAHKAAGCLTSIATAMVSLGSAIKRRIHSGRTDTETTDIDRENENPTVKTRFYTFIKIFLWMSVLLLGFEIAAYFKGWHFGAPHLQLQYLLATPFGFKDIFDSLYSRGLNQSPNKATLVILNLVEMASFQWFLSRSPCAMRKSYVKDYEFVAIFDADFQPTPDFLKRTVPHFKDNEEIGLVQARWSFVNKDENLLARLQNINLAFHFEVEQQVNGHFINFFGFNGTAGVWRIKALEESGGWLERTTVEDMDIAVRAHLHGWKFIFLNDVECQCELPESYEAYRKQQHRWHSGPMQLFRLCLPAIIRSKISMWKKFNMIFLFFLLRKLILPFYSFTLFCIILPMTMFIPEAELPAWVVCYIPATMSFLNILPAPKSFPFIVPYLLFENTMSVTKFNAMISGLFQLGSAYEWVVTKKSGRSSEGDLVSLVQKETKHQRGSSEPNLDELKEEIMQQDQKDKKKRKHNRIYMKELALAFLLLTASVRSLLSAQGIHFYFLLFQGISFLLVGLDLIGEQVQ